MKKQSWLFILLILFSASGCFDVVDETSINENGSGTLVTSSDMSRMISLLKNMGSSSQEMKDIDKVKKDTVIYMKDLMDSLTGLTDVQKKLIEKGTMHILMNFEEEKFSFSFSIPFSKPADILVINNSLKKSKMDIISKQMDKVLPGDSGEGDENMSSGKNDGTPDLGDYFNYVSENGKLARSINKEKYATIENDKALKSLQELGQMGMPVNFKTIVNLPKPAKKAEGKGIMLSDDRKKITIEGTLDDFFEDASKFEYNIEY